MKSATIVPNSQRKQELLARFRRKEIKIDELVEEVHKMDHPRRILRTIVTIAVGAVLPILFIGRD